MIRATFSRDFSVFHAIFCRPETRRYPREVAILLKMCIICRDRGHRPPVHDNELNAA